MKAIIFNGALERRPQSTSGLISRYFTEKLEMLGITHDIFALADSGIPLYDITLTKTPLAVERMAQLFLDADIHFWLAPLYHGSIPGVMKNCLDWLEITADQEQPYLTDKTVGLVCWADGLQAMQGVNTMDAIAKSLRAWPLPFSVPMIRTSLFDHENKISPFYTDKLDRLISIATSNRIEKIPHSKV
ncbi:NADPH-dependent FMN reductase [Chryseobacterium piperi]|uniref:NADPH-dependent FMN reductase n=1 Tax=Chryseobacterium piperi TaxID=558152 RepID=A0A086ALY4_9FLAO|nr:NAD(P)H-dependent oxidoreductase [Chryseobacterium piperi]ASW73959.1 NADPH-dependent oxidoreductase [Chryseobacterium piperi]KFF17698.1 NADPH-dependent FMN reductase [Chryseobacterium piperi]